MIESKLVVCAESVVRDGDTQAVSVFNIIEEIGAPAFSLSIPKLSCLFVVERDVADPEQLDGVVTVTLAGTLLEHFVVPIDFERQRRTHLIVVLQGFILHEPGLLKIALLVQGRELGAWTMRVSQVEDSRLVTAAGATR